MSKSRDQGTYYENRIVAYLHKRGFTEAEREEFSSPLGDIKGLPGITAEVKNRATVTFADWITQVKKSVAKTGDRMFCIFHNRRNYQVKDGYFTTTTELGVTLLQAWAWCEAHGVTLEAGQS